MEAQAPLPIQPATTTRSVVRTAHLPIRVFLLSDHQLLRDALALTLKNQEEISLVGAQESSRSITAEIIESTCGVLLVDPVNTSALDTHDLDHLQDRFPNLRIVMINMEAKIADIISAIFSGSRTCLELG